MYIYIYIERERDIHTYIDVHESGTDPKLYPPLLRKS